DIWSSERARLIFKLRNRTKYFNAQLITVLTLWLEADIPLELEKFRPKFLFFMNSSVHELIFKGID
ncbi:MAG: hypothetical protein ACTHUC_04505, partial [Lactococcus cremoris]